MGPTTASTRESSYLACVLVRHGSGSATATASSTTLTTNIEEDASSCAHAALSV